MVKNNKAIGYIRVSTLDQAEEGVSLDAQREKVKAYCALNNLELLTIEEDPGISGKRADNRPGLQRALKAVCGCKGVLVVYSLSRFSRSTLDCIDLSSQLKKCGADLASITEKLDTRSAMGEFFFTLIAALGQLERRQIAERTEAALGHLRRQGKRISGRIPFGFALAADGETLVADETEQTLLTRLQSLRSAGESFGGIAATLNAEGVKPKCGQRWYASSVRSVLLTAA